MIGIFEYTNYRDNLLWEKQTDYIIMLLHTVFFFRIEILPNQNCILVYSVSKIYNHCTK